MDITFEVDTAQLNQLAVRFSNAFNRLPTHLAKAMTYAAYDAQKELKRQTPNFVDNPTTWTRNATFVQKATPQNLAVRLGFKSYEDTRKGSVPAAHYLQPMVTGQPRQQKSTERQLARFSAAFQNRYLIPTDKEPLRLNSFGNISGGQYTQVLSRLKAFTAEGYDANASTSARSRRKRSQRDYFIGWRTGNPVSIRARVGAMPKGTGGKGSKQGGRPVTSNLPRGFVPVFIVSKSPKYRAQFPVRTIIQTKFNERFPSIFERIVFSGR